MLATGARQFASLAGHLGAVGPVALWIVVLGLLVAGWAAFARAGVGRLNTVAVALLIGLLLAVFVRLFFVPGDGPAPMSTSTSMRFGAALELVVVMPLSWLPLVADYNRHARNGGVAAVYTWLGTVSAVPGCMRSAC